MFGDDITIIKRSWKHLLDLGAKMIFPGHGKPFSANRLEKYLHRN